MTGPIATVTNTPRERLRARLADVAGKRWVEWGIVVLLIVVGAIISWNRVPGDHRDRVWAEDGNIFLGEALDRGPWAVFFEGYAGYQHFIPRVIAAVVVPVLDLGFLGLDLAYYAVLVFAICSVLAGLTAAGVFWLSRDLVPWLPARVALGLVTVILPLAAQETVGNLADLHTYAMWLAPWLLLYRPKSWATSVGWGVVMWALVMTEIQAIFFVFLIVFRLRKRDRIHWPVFIGFLAGAFLQVLTAVSVDRPSGQGPLSIPSTVLGWLINTVLPILTSDPLTVRAWVLETGMLVAVAVLVPVVACVVVVLGWGTSTQRLLTVALLLGSAATYTGSAWANSGPLFEYAERDLNDLGIVLVLNIRYGVASGMMLVAVVAIAAAVIRRRWGNRPAPRIVAWGLCIALVAVLANGSTSTFSIRDFVPPWSSAVRGAADACETASAPPAVTLPVAPDRSVDLSCDDILDLSPE